MPLLKTVFRFFGISLYFVLMGPVFALCALIGEDAATRIVTQNPLPHFSDYVFVLSMYWPATFIACMVPCTIVGYAYAGYLYLYSMQRKLQSGILEAIGIAALLGLAGGAVLGSPHGAGLSDAIAGAMAAAACAGMLWMLGIGRPASRQRQHPE